ncbi:hypothetical protein HYALB_00006076 [Hymenoscyphus albidus]|uniref:Efflux pump dotC n=1 Tax=Hymenoscyphus albidus TaxID=595503 RepID=A0A9N9LXZ1_9HELO|nr:hypothetical protein HYALB_00006076 [Hymenoscyphus albidus]
MVEETTENDNDTQVIPKEERESSPEKQNIQPGSDTGTNPSDNVPETERTKLQTAIIMASLCSSVFLAALDQTIVSTALPTISQRFQSGAAYTWVGSAYVLATASTTPSWGKVSDIWGRKPIILLAVSIFFIGSLLCAISVNIAMLIAARAIQGVGGGGILLLVNIVIGDLFSLRSRGQYYGMVGMIWAFASAIGPILGGVFTEKVSWRWCFYLNLPITGAVFVLLVLFLKLDNPKTPLWEGLRAVDWLGSIAITGGTVMLLLGLQFGGVTYPWGSVKVICLIVFGCVLFGLFALGERIVRYPLIPHRIFNKSNVAVFGTCFCHGYIFIAATYFLPLYFQAVLGATPILSGVYFLAFTLSLSFVGGFGGFLIKATGKYLLLIRGSWVLAIVGFGLFTDLDPSANWAKIFIFQIIAGAGVGANFQAPLIPLQSHVARGDIAAATATFAFIRNLSVSISIVVGGVVFQNQALKRSSSVPSVSQGQGLNAFAIIDIIQRLEPAQQRLLREIFTDSLRTMWIMYACFAGLGLIFSLFIASKVLNEKHEATTLGLAAEEAKRVKKHKT